MNVNDASVTSSSLVARKPATVIVHLVKPSSQHRLGTARTVDNGNVWKGRRKKVLLSGDTEGTFVRTDDAAKVEV